MSKLINRRLLLPAFLLCLAMMQFGPEYYQEWPARQLDILIRSVTAFSFTLYALHTLKRIPNE